MVSPARKRALQVIQVLLDPDRLWDVQTWHQFALDELPELTGDPIRLLWRLSSVLRNANLCDRCKFEALVIFVHLCQRKDMPPEKVLDGWLNGLEEGHRCNFSLRATNFRELGLQTAEAVRATLTKGIKHPGSNMKPNVFDGVDDLITAPRERQPRRQPPQVPITVSQPKAVPACGPDYEGLPVASPFSIYDGKHRQRRNLY